jgi:hypothetical protein
MRYTHTIKFRQSKEFKDWQGIQKNPRMARNGKEWQGIQKNPKKSKNGKECQENL